MATASKTGTSPDPKTVSFAGDVLASRIAPLVIAAMVGLICLLGATGAFADVRDALSSKAGASDAEFYELVASYDPAIWEDCYSGPLAAFMPAPIDVPQAEDEAAASNGAADDESAEATEGEAA